VWPHTKKTEEKENALEWQENTVTNDLGDPEQSE
jgi:hypothetical protein